VIYKTEMQTVTRPVQETVNEPQTRTVFRTETVPLSRTVTEQVPQVQYQMRNQEYTVNGRRYRSLVRVPVTVMATRSRQVTENVTRQVPVTTQVLVPVTRTRDVTENIQRQVARQRGKYRLTVMPAPLGVNLYYLPNILFDEFLGRKGKDGDRPEGWKAEWSPFGGASKDLWEGYYSFRGYWKIGGEYRLDNYDVTGDAPLDVKPDQ
jgi:hypothetical protein